MSDAAATLTRWRHALRCIVTGVVLYSAPVGAQSSTDLARDIAALRDSIKVTQALLNERANRLALTADDSLTADGVTVLFPRAALTASDEEAVRAGLAQAKRDLNARYGAGAERLLDGDFWNVRVAGQRDGRYDVASLQAGRRNAVGGGRAIALPVKPEAVKVFALARAGTRLLERDPKLSAFASGSFTFASDEPALHVARFRLAVSNSSVARRCADGVLRACRLVLNPNESDRWFAPGDSVRGNGRPIPKAVHGSLVTVAMELGGARAMNALGESHDLDEPVAILAKAAGITPDSLLVAWDSRLRTASVSRARPALSFAASAVAWWGIFLLAATRRRPR